MPPFSSLTRFEPEAVDGMVVDDADSLHPGVDDGRANERESTALQVRVHGSVDPRPLVVRVEGQRVEVESSTGLGD